MPGEIAAGEEPYQILEAEPVPAESAEVAVVPPKARSSFRPDPLYHWVILTLVSGVLVLAVVLSVRDETQVLVPILNAPLPELCTFRRFLGLNCPGCGLTRCFISLAHGDVRSAWSYNPAGLVLFALFAIQIPYRGVQLWRIRRGLPELRPIRFAQWSLGLVAVMMFVQWIVRLCGVQF